VTWIKICGTTSLHDAELSVASGADALGFIFAPSPRRIDPALAAEIVAALPVEVEKIGVFVNESPARVAEIVTQVGLTGVQLHGDETAEQLGEFRQALGGRKIIKTLQVRELLSAGKDGAAEVSRSSAHIDAVLLDSGSAARPGGTGVRFEWEKAAPLAAAIQSVVPVIIAGGLNAANVGAALHLFHPWGIDVVSGVEREPGKKDEAKLPEFISAVRQQQSEVG
jgi:phosphoribosylanthranilate isomerase